jgi:CHAT domain-containing protein
VAKGDLYADLKKFETSLSHYQRAIACLVVEFDPNRDDNPNLGMVFSKKKLFSVLQQKYRVLELMSREDKADLKMLVRAWQTNRLALALLDSIANEFSLERDRIILAEQSFKANEDGLRLGYQLFLKSKEEHYLKDCFSIAEKSKSILLLENIRRVNRFAGINKEWQDKERDLKSEILYYEQEIYHATAKEKNTKQLLTLREEYNQTRHQYALLMEKIKKENPHFYHLRFDRNAISEATIQSELLANGDALIEFFIGENQMAIFGFSKKSSYAEVQDTPTDLNYKLLQFRKLLTSADSLTPGKEYDRLAKELFAVLMANCLKSLGPVTRLIIVPDGILGYLPFEVLQEQREGNSPLISNYTITYAYSASYLHEQVFKQSSPASHFFAGFTSDANPAGVHKSPGLAALKYARKEITTISETLGQGYKVFDHCTKQEFMDNAPDYTVLHLAMHATTNDENPMFSAMMFSPSKADSNSFDPLFAIDLYSFQLKAKLVVLSACETGLGEWHRGEGIISLSRAFAYSGVPSSVISLWKVPDKATSILMKSFYGHLKSENSKDAALALAKRDFVKNYPQMSHPYYWSGFILMGDHRSLEFPENRLWIYILSGITILLLTTLFFWRRNQIRQKEKIAHE